MIAFLFISVLLANLGVTVWSVIDIATKEFKDKDSRVIWMIVVLALGGIGPWIYLAMRSKLLVGPNDQKPDYLPPLREEEARPQVQSRLDYDDDQYV
jgi:hypothetical protein